MFYVKVSDALGDIWHEYKEMSEAFAFAVAVDGEVFTDAVDTTNERIEKAVLSYMEKKTKHIVVTGA